MRLVLLAMAAALLSWVAPAHAAPLNVVYVLADDLRSDDLRYMPEVRQLMREGTSFSNFIVTDSRCCPSRASTFTGRMPHNTGVYGNAPPRGGYQTFVSRGMEQRTFAGPLAEKGYRTALIGKYLNGYGAGGKTVPEGWTDWAASARGYRGFDYKLNINGHRQRYGEDPSDYVTDVLAGLADAFITEVARLEQPFFVEVAPFTPHLPAVPAPRHSGLYPNVRAPRGPAYNRAVQGAPSWLSLREPFTPLQIAQMDSEQRDRTRSLASVDELVGQLRKRLAELGLAKRTVFIFNSDNGFHVGEHRLLSGKFTAFDEDIRVPLVVAGPGVAREATVDAMVQNTDLAPTFVDIAGGPVGKGVDGRSLWPLARGRRVPADWRRAALVEHVAVRPSVREKPDQQTAAAGDPPTYFALRTRWTTYVQYATGEREFYDRRRDPHELRNVYDKLPPRRRRQLRARLLELRRCNGAEQCATER